MTGSSVLGRVGDDGAWIQQFLMRVAAVGRLEILAVLDAPRLVDLPPIQIWAMLLHGLQ